MIQIDLEAIRARRDYDRLDGCHREDARALLNYVDALAVENAALKSQLTYAASTGDECAIEVEALRKRLAAVTDERETTVAELRSRIEALRKDADRYRWLRHGDNDDVVLRITELGDSFVLRTEQLDATIDAAMGESHE